MKQAHIDELLTAWQGYCAGLADWQSLVQGVEPKQSGCGLLFELPSPLTRPGEDFAIADMRRIAVAEPHYHPKDNWEFYIVLQGTATVVVGGKPQRVAQGDSVIIPPDTAHFTIPDNQVVIAAINTPPFKPENYIKLESSNAAVHFDAQQFKGLTKALAAP
jgi:mannose-6-phosphate isomerase-like protein (cupin superfamily)